MADSRLLEGSVSRKCVLRRTANLPVSLKSGMLTLEKQNNQLIKGSGTKFTLN